MKYLLFYSIISTLDIMCVILFVHFLCSWMTGFKKMLILINLIATFKEHGVQILAMHKY